MNNGNLPASSTNLAIDEYEGTINCPTNKPLTGLTKREHFAAMAIQGLLANSHLADVLTSAGADGINAEAHIIKSAVSFADLLLKELNK